MIEFVNFPPRERGDVIWTEDGRKTIAKLLEKADGEMSRSSSDEYGKMVSKWSTVAETSLKTVCQVVASTIPENESAHERRSAVLGGLMDDLLSQELTGVTSEEFNPNFNPYTGPQIAERVARNPVSELRHMAS